MAIKCLSDLEKHITDKTYWNVTRDKYDLFENWILSQDTPEGEDFSFIIPYVTNSKNVLDGINKSYNDFDVDEHVKLYINSLGKDGVPDSISRLLVDAQWIKNNIEALAKEVQKVLQPEKTK